MRTRKLSIADMMWIVLFVAVGLVLARGGPETRWLGRWWLVLFLGGMAFCWVWFIRVPLWSLKLAHRSREGQRRVLRWVVNTPAPGALKVLARYLLAANDQVGKRYDEAEAGFRSILCDHGAGLDPAFESVLRQHLADTIDALGRREEAQAERKQAGAILAGDDETFLGFQARGTMLDREHRFAEAVTCYERALSLSPPGQKAVHVQLMMQLVLSTFNAGRPADTLRWAEAVIGLDPDGFMVPHARRMAAVACSNLGRLEDAERHSRIGVELAPSPEQRAETLALLGDYVMRRGDLDGAERIAREAEAMLPGQKRMPWLIIAQVERERDRLEEAIRAREKAKTVEVGHIPPLNRRMNAVIDNFLAIDHVELGHRDIALQLIEGAEAELAGDPKLGVTLDAAAALVYALAGERDEALDRIASADRGRHDVPEDGSTQRSVLSLLGWAALEVDDPERAEDFLHSFLDLEPDPLYWPYAWYHLATCRRGLGDEAGGREYDAMAASSRFGCRWERYARERLAADGIRA
jgi:tetratricopeptide (TPR) repeat protein